MPTALQPLRLSELAGSLERMFHHHYGAKQFWVVAEITDYKLHSSGHRYFRLVEKDEDTNELTASFTAMIWRSAAHEVKTFEETTGQRFGNNLQVLVCVSVSFHARYGVSLTVHRVDAGYSLGRLEQERQRTLDRLVAENPDHIQRLGEGYRTTNNQLSFGRVLQRIAVISSTNSEGFRDFQHTLEHNAFGYRFRLHVFMGAVQGEANAEELTLRLRAIAQAKESFDAVVLIRGGGADTDFLLFNQYTLCRQIALMPAPVIVGLGHQKNQTIADLMAHTSVKTPSIAAEFLIAHNRRFEEGMLELRNRMLLRVQRQLAGHRQSLHRLQNGVVEDTRQLLAQHKEEQARIRQVLTDGSRMILSKRRYELAAAEAGLRSAAQGFVRSQQAELDHYRALMRVMSPTHLLRRGFALVYQEGKIITSGAQLNNDQPLTVRLSDYEVQTRITQKTLLYGNESDV